MSDVLAVMLTTDGTGYFAQVIGEDGRSVTFRPGSDLTVPDLFRAAELGLLGPARDGIIP